jgi:hypothetical protein
VTIEWFPFSAISATRTVAVNAFTDIFRNAAYDYFELAEDRRIVPDPGDFLGAREWGASPRPV